MDALIGADLDGNVTWWSRFVAQMFLYFFLTLCFLYNERRAGQMFGYQEDEIIGNNLQLLMPERYRELHQQGLNAHRNTDSLEIENFGKLFCCGTREVFINFSFH